MIYRRDIELWKDIKEYEGYYQSSTWGQIKSLDRYVEYSLNGGGLKFLKGKIKKLGKQPANPLLTIDECGNDYYLITSLYKNKIGKSRPVARLIAETFIPNPFNLPEVNHIDENKQNNNVWNLEWTNNREQTSHRSSTKKNKTSKYTGVCWFNHVKKWHAQISVNGTTKNLGCFLTEEEASNAYQEALKEIGQDNRYATFA